MADFKSLSSTVKGDFGEELVLDMLKRKGWNFLENPTNKAHFVDRIMYIKTDENKEFKGVEIKTKDEMKYYNATGVDLNKWADYNFLHDLGFEIVFFFVGSGAVKYTTFEEMIKKIDVEENGKIISYPNFEICYKQKIVMISTTILKTFCLLNEAQNNELKKLTHSNYS